MGSKSRIAKYIVPIIQKYINDNHIDTFIDAFVGGGSVIQNINALMGLTDAPDNTEENK